MASYSPNSFVIKVDTRLYITRVFKDTFDDKTIKLSLMKDGVYDFNVNWGDGNISHITNPLKNQYIHSYEKAGE